MLSLLKPSCDPSCRPSQTNAALTLHAGSVLSRISGLMADSFSQMAQGFHNRVAELQEAALLRVDGKLLPSCSPVQATAKPQHRSQSWCCRCHSGAACRRHRCTRGGPEAVHARYQGLGLLGLQINAGCRPACMLWSGNWQTSGAALPESAGPSLRQGVTCCHEAQAGSRPTQGSVPVVSAGAGPAGGLLQSDAAPAAHLGTPALPHASTCLRQPAGAQANRCSPCCATASGVL